MRRRDAATSTLLATLTLFTLAILLMAISIRIARQPRVPIVVRIPADENANVDRLKPNQSHSHHHYRPRAPQHAESRARVIRSVAPRDVFFPDSPPPVDLAAWVSSQNDSDFGESIGSYGEGFFGIARQAKRVAFVVDVSSSMSQSYRNTSSFGTTRLASLKEQLSQSIAALPQESRFAVIFFNDRFWQIANREDPFASRKKQLPRWRQATDPNKSQAIAQLRHTEASGGTEWVAPLAEAINLKPAPQVLYLLSDGEPSDWEEVQPHLYTIRNRGVAIDTIALESGDTGAKRLREVAKRTGGSFRRIKNGKIAERADPWRHQYQPARRSHRP